MNLRMNTFEGQVVALSFLLLGGCDGHEAPLRSDDTVAEGPSGVARQGSTTSCGATCCPFGWDKVMGSSGSDELEATERSSCLVSDAGEDRLTTPDGSAMFAYAGPGNDVVSGGPRRDGLNGGLGDDSLSGAGMTDFLDGGEGDDRLEGGDGPDVMFGSAGRDTLHGDNGRDRLYLGAGADDGHGGAGNDLIFAGPGADKVFGGAGNDEARGEAGADTLAGEGGADRLYGGPGDDKLSGGPGPDILYPGMGRDESDGGEGDDILRIVHPCELESGEVLDGGTGDDTLYSHLSRADLARRGVVVRNIENVVLLDSEPFDSACELGVEKDSYAELVGVATYKESFWRDNRGRSFPLDGEVHTRDGADLWTRTYFQVDTVVSAGDTNVLAGETVSLVRPGGSSSLLGGGMASTSVCCLPEVHAGGRYRVSLSWDREQDEFQQAFDFGVDQRNVPFFPLPAFGTLPFVPDNAESQVPGPICPLPPLRRSFPSPEAAVEWAKMGNIDNDYARWDQTYAFEDPPEGWGNVVRFEMSYGWSTRNACGEPEFSYEDGIFDGSIRWQSGTAAGDRHGILVAGDLYPYTLESCEAGADDSANCIAIQGEPEDDGQTLHHDIEDGSNWQMGGALAVTRQEQAENPAPWLGWCLPRNRLRHAHPESRRHPVGGLPVCRVRQSASHSGCCDS